MKNKVVNPKLDDDLREAEQKDLKSLKHTGKEIKSARKGMFNTPIRFIHISDTHIGAEGDFSLYGVEPLPPAQKLVKHIQRLPEKPDFIVHTGDIVHEIAGAKNEKAYKKAEELFSRLNIPIYYVTGNHDTTEPIKKYLSMGEKKDLSHSLNAYRFDRGGIRFIAIDARGPDEIDPHGLIADEQMEIIRNEIESKSENMPLVLFIHFPAVPLDSTWLDRDMRIQNGDILHSLLAKHKNRIKGVFIGHVHRGMQIVHDGVYYSSVGSSFIQFQSWSEQSEPNFESTGRGYFNFVTISERGALVKEYSFPNGAETFVKERADFD